MAHLLQRLTTALVVLGCAASAAGQKPFSHRLHLGLKLGCVQCHASAPSSVKASDNLLPSAAVCRQCHQQEMPIKQPRESFVSKFNHALHVKMGNVAPVIASAIDRGDYLSPAPPGYRAQLDTKNACAGCHHGIETSDAVSAANFPRMGDCLVCHREIEVPFSCEKCHEPGPRLKPANHTPDFMDSHSRRAVAATLEKSTCAVCHGRKFTCLGCH